MIGRWLSHSLNLILSLMCAILAMQAPALTHTYLDALTQVSAEARHDIDTRKASARSFYAIAAEDDDGVVTALKAREPSNAETLALAIERERVFVAAHDHIAGYRPVLQPIVTITDTLADHRTYKIAVLRRLLTAYELQVGFSLAALLYGAVGLLFGSFLAQLILAIGGRRTERRPRSFA